MTLRNVSMSWRARLGSLLALLTLMTAGCTPDTAFDGPRTSVAQAGALTDTSPAYDVYRPGNRFGTAYDDFYLDEVQQVFAQRCAGCHSCSSGPCQLNLTSYETAVRGMKRENPYRDHLAAWDRTRPDDPNTTDEWREMGFQSVLGAGHDPVSNLESSILLEAVQLGLNNEASEAKTGGGVFSMEVVRELAPLADAQADWACPSSPQKLRERSDELGGYGGMPLGMPALTDEEFAIIARWIELGAPGPSAEARAALESPQAGPYTTVDPKQLVATWESFLNGDSLREQLTARYIYEHSANARWHLSENPGEFYRLVRSKTPAPQPLDEISTEWVNDDPGVERVYYRLKKHTRVIETKVHVVWERSLGDLARLRDTFLGPEWSIDALPGYEVNPFLAFHPIPVRARSAFMRENSRMLLQSFGRGPICVTQAASYAVADHFWVFFLSDEADPSVQVPDLGLGSYKTFYDRPRTFVDSLEPKGFKWGEAAYRNGFERVLRAMKPEGLSVNDIWDGGGENPNAWVTAFRHQHSHEFQYASNQFGGLPQSIWLLSYANFERMYYNAALHFKYWGSQKHKLETFSHQTYTRTEAEDLFLSLLADSRERDRMRGEWTSWVARYMEGLHKNYTKGRPAADKSMKTVEDLYLGIYNRMSDAVRPANDVLNNWPEPAGPVEMPEASNLPLSRDGFEAGIRSLTGYRAPFVRYVPNLMHVRFAGEHLYTFAPARGYQWDKIAWLEGQSRRPEKDTLSAFPGIRGAFSYVFMEVPANKAAVFLRELRDVASARDWARFAEKYKVARNSDAFWPTVDFMHRYAAEHYGKEAGLFDLRYYDMEDKPF